MSSTTRHTQLVVIGGGPGGYPAAFIAADHGMEVTLVDQEAQPGGVCLYRGCIPSKALLHLANLISETREASEWGVTFAEPKIELDKLRLWKNTIIQRLTGGLGGLTRQRKITHIQARARFQDNKTLLISKKDGTEELLSFDNAIVATGSRPTAPANLNVESDKVMDSTGALELRDIPKQLLVVGGGYIGCELGSVYAALGSKVTLVEMTGGILPGTDRDLVIFLQKRLEKLFETIYLRTKVAELRPEQDGVVVRLEGLHISKPEQKFDRVLVSVGRRPNSEDLGLDKTQIALTERGFIKIDKQCRTAESHIFAIGDVAGEPMLAHKATHEGRVAVESILGMASVFNPQAIPAVVFTDPEIAWCGLTEMQAKEQGRPVRIAQFPWAASGRATTLSRNDGLTKLLLDPHTEQILGVGIVGVGAGELIAEGALAVEMAARAEDLKSTIHAHPTLSETIMEAAESFFGQAVHFYKRQ